MVKGKPETKRADLSHEDRDELERMMEEALKEDDVPEELVKDIKRNLQEYDADVVDHVKAFDGDVIESESSTGDPGAGIDQYGKEKDVVEQEGIEEEEELVPDEDPLIEVEEEAVSSGENLIEENPEENDENGEKSSLLDISEWGLEDASASDSESDVERTNERSAAIGVRGELSELPECGDDALEMVNEYRRYEELLRRAAGARPRIPVKHTTSSTLSTDKNCGPGTDQRDEDNNDGNDHGVKAGEEMGTRGREHAELILPSGRDRGKKKERSRLWKRTSAGRQTAKPASQGIDGFMDSMDIINPAEASKAVFRRQEERKKKMKKWMGNVGPVKTNPNVMILAKCEAASNRYIFSGVLLFFLFLFGARLPISSSGSWNTDVLTTFAWSSSRYVFWLEMILVYYVIKSGRDIRNLMDIQVARNVGIVASLCYGLYIIRLILEWISSGTMTPLDFLPFLGLIFQLMGIIYLDEVKHYYLSFARRFSIPSA